MLFIQELSLRQMHYLPISIVINYQMLSGLKLYRPIIL